MTIATSRPIRERKSSGPIRWKSVQKGLWVGERDGEFAGLIESTRGGGFAAMTCFGSPKGAFTTLDAAKQSFAG
ncbi:MAG: hypothetical protein ACOH10_04735 [Rhodoglobus sp.]